MDFSTPVLDTPNKKIEGVSGARPAATDVMQPVEPALRLQRLNGLYARMWRDRGALAATVLLVLMVTASALAPLLSPFEADATDFSNRLLPPSLQHPFGTDDLGRDVFVRVMKGGRVSLTAGILATVIAVLLGTILGAVSGYTGGVADALMMRATDLMLSIPTFFIVLLLASLMSPGIFVLCVLIGVTQWTEVSRVVRSVVLSTKRNDFVEAARAVGLPARRILFHHILRHTGGPLLVATTIGIAQAIMMESALSFLGFGVQPPAVSWGSMLKNAQAHLGPAPWAATFPGLMIFATVLCCYSLGDFFRSLLDPNND